MRLSLIFLVTLCVLSTNSVIYDDVAQICGNNGSVYQTINTSGRVQTLYADFEHGLISQNQTRQYRQTHNCFLTLVDIKFGSWILVNLTAIDILNSDNRYPEILISNDQGSVKHSVTTDSAIGTAMFFIVDESFLSNERYVLRFRLSFNKTTNNQAIRVVFTYITADILSGGPDNPSTLNSAQGFIVSHSAFNYGQDMGGDYSSEPISGSKILLLTPISHIVVRFLYFDLADGDYLNLTLTTREETVGSVYFCGGRELDLSESISLYSGQLEGELVFSFNSTNKSNSSGFLIEYSVIGCGNGGCNDSVSIQLRTHRPSDSPCEVNTRADSPIHTEIVSLQSVLSCVGAGLGVILLLTVIIIGTTVSRRRVKRLNRTSVDNNGLSPHTTMRSMLSSDLNHYAYIDIVTNSTVSEENGDSNEPHYEVPVINNGNTHLLREYSIPVLIHDDKPTSEQTGSQTYHLLEEAGTGTVRDCGCTELDMSHHDMSHLGTSHLGMSHHVMTEARSSANVYEAMD